MKSTNATFILLILIFINVQSNAQTQRVGIGTNFPETTLDVRGTGLFKYNSVNSSSPHINMMATGTNYSRLKFSNNLANHWILAARPSNNLDASVFHFFHGIAGGNILSLFGNGEIGVNKSIGLEDRFTIDSEANENAFRVQVNGVTKFRVFGNGSVGFGNNTGISRDNVHVKKNLGIGVLDPVERLEVDGSMVAKKVTSNEMIVQHPDDTILDEPLITLNNPLVTADAWAGIEFQSGGEKVSELRSNGSNSTYHSTFQIWTKTAGFINNELDIRTGVTSVNNLEPFDSYSRLGQSNNPWGYVYAGVYNTTSDKRAKAKIEDLTYGLEEVIKLAPKKYHYKNDKKQTKRLGLIAQEVIPIIPEVVDNSNPEHLSMSYQDLVPVLINSIKELKEKNDQLLQRIEKLENTIQE